MAYIIDVSEAIDGFIVAAGENYTPDELESMLNENIQDQLNGVVDYVEGITDGDYEKEDLVELWKEGYFQIANTVVGEDPEADPEALLTGELFEMLVGVLIGNGDPLSPPSRTWSRHGTLIKVDAHGDT